MRLLPLLLWPPCSRSRSRQARRQDFRASAHPRPGAPAQGARRSGRRRHFHVARNPARQAHRVPSVRARGDERLAARRRHSRSCPRECAVHQRREWRLGDDHRPGRTGRLSLRLRREWRRRDRSEEHRDQRIEHDHVERGDGARFRSDGHEETCRTAPSRPCITSRPRSAARGGCTSTRLRATSRARTSIRSSIFCMARETATIRGRRWVARISSSTT